MESPSVLEFFYFIRIVLNALRHLIWNHINDMITIVASNKVLNALRHLIWNHCHTFFKFFFCFIVLNALRHLIWNHFLGTRRCPRDPPRAQRLTASDMESLPQSLERFLLPFFVLNALRHLIWNHSQSSSSDPSTSGAQRLTASDMESLGRYNSIWCFVPVLNALRHLIWNHQLPYRSNRKL